MSTDIIFVLLIFLIIFLIILFTRKGKTFLRLTATFFPNKYIRIILFSLGGVSIGHKPNIPFGTYLSSKVSLGNNVKIGRGVTIGSNSIIGDNVVIESNVIISRATIGNGTHIHRNAVIYGNKSNSLSIGESCFIGYSALLDGTNKIEIGNFVHIAGPSVSITTHSSIKNSLLGNYPKTNEYSKNQIEGEIIIKDNTWIGGKVSIYPNVTIGPKSAILPNSVVNKDIPSLQMFGGIPATLKRNISTIGNKVIFEEGQ